jgi:hypothetical protein
VAVNPLLTKDDRIDEKWKHRFHEIFGSSDWDNVFYQANSQASLFGHATEMRKTADFPAILA